MPTTLKAAFDAALNGSAAAIETLADMRNDADPPVVSRKRKPRAAVKGVKPTPKAKPKATKPKATPKPKAKPLNADQKDAILAKRLDDTATKRASDYEAVLSNRPAWERAADRYISDFGTEVSSSRVVAALCNKMFQHRMDAVPMYQGFHWKQLNAGSASHCEAGKVLWKDIEEVRKYILAKVIASGRVARNGQNMPWTRIKDAAFKAWPKPPGFGANPNAGKTVGEKAKAPLSKIYFSIANEEIQSAKERAALKHIAAALTTLGVDLLALNEKLKK